MYKPAAPETIGTHAGDGGPMVVRTENKIIFRDEKNAIVDANFSAWERWGGHTIYLPVRCANFDGDRKFHLRPKDWFGIELPQMAEPDTIDTYGAIYYLSPEGFNERIRTILPDMASRIMLLCLDYMRLEYETPPASDDAAARLVHEFINGLDLT